MTAHGAYNHYVSDPDVSFYGASVGFRQLAKFLDHSKPLLEKVHQDPKVELHPDEISFIPSFLLKKVPLDSLLGSFKKLDSPIRRELINSLPKLSKELKIYAEQVREMAYPKLDLKPLDDERDAIKESLKKLDAIYASLDPQEKADIAQEDTHWRNYAKSWADEKEHFQKLGERWTLESGNFPQAAIPNISALSGPCLSAMNFVKAWRSS